MKRSMLVAAGMMISLAACAQKVKETEVPSAVKEAFRKTYPNVKEMRWEKEDLNFEVEFELGETDESLVYDPSGQLLQREVEIKTEELPAAAKAYIAGNYKNEKIKEAAKITDVKGEIRYEAEVKDKDLIFDATGKFIKEEADSQKEKD